MKTLLEKFMFIFENIEILSFNKKIENSLLHVHNIPVTDMYCQYEKRNKITLLFNLLVSSISLVIYEPDLNNDSISESLNNQRIEELYDSLIKQIEIQ